MEKKEKLRKRLYKMVDGFIEVCDLDSEYYLVEKNDYTTKIMEQEVRDMASNIELDKAREEGINSVLFPKFKREKNGTIKQDGWVNTFKFKDEKLNLYIWERVNMMSSNWHSEGGVVIVAKSLERAREIAKEHFNPEEEHSTLTDYDTTVFDTEPNRVFEVSSSEEYYCDFPDAGCC